MLQNRIISATFLFSVISTIFTNNVIDVDDILSAEFMPGAILLLENPQNFSTVNETVHDHNLFSNNSDGSMDNAMETMGFHRMKMNEYLCRNYIAEQIISDMTLTRIKRRLNGVYQSLNESQTSVSALKNDLLYDEGSSNYKDWLSKSTTLEDIYRHYNNIDNHIQDRVNTEKTDATDYDVDFVDKRQHMAEQKRAPEKMGHSAGGSGYLGGYPYPPASSGYGDGGHHSMGTGYDNGPTGYGGGGGMIRHGGGGHPSYYPEPEQPHYHVYEENYSNDKEHDLSDLFDIALTALAFLAFKLFLIHVIMCISATNNAATTTPASMMMPMSMSPTAEGPNTTTDSNTTPTQNGGGDTGGGATGGTGGGDTGGGDGDTGGGDGGGDSNGGGTSPDTATGTGGGGVTATGGTATGGDTATGGTSTGGTGGGTATATGNDGDTIRVRFPRHTKNTPDYNNRALNELARRILTTIEAAFLANEDSGECLRKTLCENNRYSRRTEGNNRILLPLWSLGMSWLSGRLATNINPTTSMLDTLKASILGLGKANCEIVYQNCDLRQQRQERRRNRRKRQSVQ